MTFPTGEAVWSALLEDEDFVKNPLEVQVAQEAYVLKLPEIAASYIGELVTLETLARVKVAYLQFCLEQDYPTSLAEAISTAGCQTMEFADLVEFYAQRMQLFIEGVDSLISETAQLLLETQLSEKHVVIAIFQLNEAAVKQYCAETLTIGQLMLLDPLVLVRNF